MKDVFITDDLREYAEKFLRDNYGIDPIDIRANGRFTRTLGQYVREWDLDPQSNEPEVKYIELAKDLLRYGHRDVILDVLRHELIHYALQTLGRPYKDGDEEFESELIKHKATAAGGLRVGMNAVYICKECTSEVITRKIIPENRLCLYVSKCCSAPITYETERVYDGRNHEYVTR